MSDTGSGPSLVEIARQVRDALTRLETLATRIEDNYVPNRILELLRDNINLKFSGQDQRFQQLDREITNLDSDNQRELSTKADTTAVTALEQRIRSLEDDRKWLVRLAVGAVIAALIALVLTVPGSLVK